MAQEQVNICLLSKVEPKIVIETCKDEYWIKTMEEELMQTETNQTWEHVPRLANKIVIGTKWLFQNKLNENLHFVRRKEMLVCTGY